jgi:hypothetical protein
MHARDFGVEGNWNNVNAEKFQNAILDHVNGPNAQEIKGTYRDTMPVTHYFDPSAKLDVMVDREGNFFAGWKLYPSQLEDLLTNGNVR